MAPVLPLALAAIGAFAALALGGKKKGTPTSGKFTLDANMSDSDVQQVLGAIATQKDPSALNLFATQMDAKGFPLAANALRMRAAELAGGPLPDPQGLDGNMDPATKTAVLQALATETNPDKLVTFAGTIQLQYPIAAGLLVAKANALGGGTPMAAPQAAQPSAPQPSAPVSPAVLALPSPGVYVAPMAPSAPPSAAPAGPPMISPALVAEAQAALASSDPNQVNQAWNDINAALAGAGGIDAAAPSLSASLKALVARLMAQGPGNAPTLDNVLPPRPAPVPMPPPNPTPLGAPAPPPDGATWVLATNADVQRDGTASRYASLLASPVGTEVHETYGGRLWKLRVISKTTDPGLTTYAKDVKGWIAKPSSVVSPTAPAASPAAPIPSSPMAPPAPAPVTQPLTGVQQAALAMANAIGSRGYKQSDQGIYKALQSAAGLTADGFPGAGTMGKLAAVLASAGLPPLKVKVYPWHTMPGVTGYNGTNAPTWAEWSGGASTSLLS